MHQSAWFEFLFSLWEPAIFKHHVGSAVLVFLTEGADVPGRLRVPVLLQQRHQASVSVITVAHLYHHQLKRPAVKLLV